MVSFKSTREWNHFKKKKAETFVSAFIKVLAVTYSRGSYTTTTIGKTAFDGRVRDGNGSDHSFITTKVLAHGHCENYSPVGQLSKLTAQNVKDHS